MLPFFSFLQSNVCCICILPSFGFFSIYGPIWINWRGCDINLEYLILSYLSKRFVVSSIHLSRVIVKANSKHFFSLETFQLWPIFTFPAVISLWLWNKNLWKYSRASFDWKRNLAVRLSSLFKKSNFTKDHYPASKAYLILRNI